MTAADIEVPAKVSVTTSDAGGELAQVPVPASTYPLQVSGIGVGATSTPSWDIGGGGGRREPMVIIRGGAGGPRDDCKIHGAGRTGGIAVNRLVPGPGGQQVHPYLPGPVRIR